MPRIFLAVKILPERKAVNLTTIFQPILLGCDAVWLLLGPTF
jgi:hypothetical protein